MPRNWIFCNNNQKKINKNKKNVKDCLNELASALRKLTFWKYLFKQVKQNISAMFGKQCYCVCSKCEVYSFILNKQWRIRHLSRKFDVFFNLFFEIKHSTNEPSSVCAEKSCLSHMYNTSVCNQLDNQIQIKSVVLIVAILNLNSAFWLRLKLYIKT